MNIKLSAPSEKKDTRSRLHDTREETHTHAQISFEVSRLKRTVGPAVLEG